MNFRIFGARHPLVNVLSSFQQIMHSKPSVPLRAMTKRYKQSYITNLFSKKINEINGRRIGAKNRLIEGEYPVTPMRSVPRTVSRPDYADSGQPGSAPPYIVQFKDENEINKIRKAARLARKMLDYANSLARPGITTDEIDRLTHLEIVRNGAYPSPINFHGFPKAICASVNEVVCHGIPDTRPLESGDMLSIDVSLFLDGYHGDNCGTVIVGEGDDTAYSLMNTTQLALDRAIEVCKPGNSLKEVGKVIERTAKENGFQVVHEFCGHGTGPILHMQPLVYHFDNNVNVELVPGMVFTIEPILVEGDRKIQIWEDNWTAATVDGGRAAQFEHEILITSTGAEILTVNE